MKKKNKTKTIQRNWHQWVHKTQDEDKQNKDNLEKLAPLGKQDTRRGPTEQRQSRETGTIWYTRHMTKKNRTKTIQRN